MTAVNAARGEVAVTVGGQDLVVQVTPDALCRFSAAIGAESFLECVTRAGSAEPVAVREGLRTLVVRGDGAKAWGAIALTEFVVFGHAVSAALTAHIPAGDDPGNAGGEAANPAPSPTT